MTEQPLGFRTLMEQPRMTLRHLARSKDGRVIHRENCRHARFPWYAADDLSDDDLLSVKLNFGYRVCKACNPDWQMEVTDDH